MAVNTPNGQYIGARYVPKVFKNPDDGSAYWKANTEYEALTIVVVNSGDSYTSRQAVPRSIGSPENNPDYWAKTGDFNASLLALQNKVSRIDEFVGDETLKTNAQTLSGGVNELSYLNVFKTPQMFGAKGDGITDDTEAINKALVGGGIVFFPQGEYLIKPYDGVHDGDYLIAHEVYNGGLVVSSNTYMICDNATLKMTPTNYGGYNFIRIVNKENVVVNGFNIIGDKGEHTGTSGQHGFGIYCANSKNVNVLNCNVSNMWGDGIYIGKLYNVNLNNSSNIYLYKNETKNNRRNGITLGSCDGVTVDECTSCYTEGVSPNSGIDVEAEGYNALLKNVKIKNTKTNNNVYGINIYIPSNIDSLSIDNYTGESNGTDILCYGSPTTAKASNMSILLNDINIFNTGGCAIRISNKDKSNGVIKASNIVIFNSNQAEYTDDNQSGWSLGSAIVASMTRENEMGNIFLDQITIIDTRSPKVINRPIYVNHSSDISDVIFSNIVKADAIRGSIIGDAKIANGNGIIKNSYELFSANYTDNSVSITTTFTNILNIGSSITNANEVIVEFGNGATITCKNVHDTENQLFEYTLSNNYTARLLVNFNTGYLGGQLFVESGSSTTELVVKKIKYC